MKCKICNKYCKSIRSLSSHLKYHDTNLLNYRIMYENFKTPICPYCGEKSKLKKASNIKYCLTCGSKQCISTHCHKMRHSEKTKEILRNKRFNYLKKKNKNTAWQTHHRREMSYLENWFYENVVIKYELCNKYDVIYEYPFYPYFIDFAFLNIQLAVELDGGTHFDKNGDRIQRDKDKDKLLLYNGWSVFRINYQETNEHAIQKFLEYIGNIDILNPKIFESKIHRGKIQKIKKRKYGTRKDYFKKINEEYAENQKETIEIVENSDVDFSKFGWVKKIAELTNRNPQKIQNWMRKFCPDIWAKAYKTTKAKDYKEVSDERERIK